MNFVSDTLLVKNNDSGFEIVDIQNMQKIELSNNDIIDLFISYLKNIPEEKYKNSFKLEQVEKIETTILEIKKKTLEKLMKETAFRSVHKFNGEEAKQKNRADLIEYVKKYRILCPEEKINKIPIASLEYVLIDENFNITKEKR